MKTILEQAAEIGFSLRKENHTKEQYFAKYEEFKALNLSEYLATFQVKKLKLFCIKLHCFYDSRDKKADLVKKIYEAIQGLFFLDRNITWTFGESMDNLAGKLIEATTEGYLTKFYTKQTEEKAAKEKALSNPETITEFKDFCREFGKDKLTTEQKETYERLLAEVTKARQEREKEEKKTVEAVNCEGLNLSIHETKHSKTGNDIFTVVMNTRVEKDVFIELRIKAKKLGGYYSRYSDKFANPPIVAGFNFNTMEEAQTFTGITEEAQTADTESRDLSKKEKQVLHLRKMANTLKEKGEKSNNTERLDNTHRRAAQAASAEATASNQIRQSKVLFSIADALEDGKIEYLGNLKTLSQLDQLESILGRGYSLRLSSLNLSYTEKQNQERNPREDVNFIVYPVPTYNKEYLIQVLESNTTTSGIMQECKRLLRSVKAEKGNLYKAESNYILEGLTKVGNKIKRSRNSWEADRILEPIQEFNRVQRMGLVNEAILKTALRELIQLNQGAEPTQAEKDERKIKELERGFIGKKINGFFPTPKPLIEKMFSMAKVFEGETILEPSAGMGHIAEEIRSKYPENKLSLIEFNYDLSKLLRLKGFEDTESMNFLASSHKYDVIFMNPPFENHQDIDHVKHAYNLLKDGGRLVAIMAGNKGNSQKKVKDFVDFVEDKNGYFVDNEAGAFKDSFNSTNVNTTMLYLEKETIEDEEEEEEENQTRTRQTEQETTKVTIHCGQYSMF